MKQEAANTFSEGLNYDLNPTTTPNNVLTDCVNGTFLTFNGDELALQNDAGNTTIPTPVSVATIYDPLITYNTDDIIYTSENQYYKCISIQPTTAPLTDTTVWEEMAVKLSDGFYPIGIKEYGGVLYIVSAKKPDFIPMLFNDVLSYGEGDVVYTHIIDTDYYYESLVDINTEPLPFESNEYWLAIGVEKDFINKYGQIEFGSYPSPEIVDADRLDTSIPYEIINDSQTVAEDFKAALYSPKIINNSPFRAGVYVQFTSDLISLVSDAISYRAYTYDETTEIIEQQYIPKTIYKVRLLHQLTNGFIELTDSVWEKYAIYYKTTTGFDLNTDIGANGKHFWFADPDFKYFCPHNFKGKLAITVELEEYDEFYTSPITIEEDTGTDEYVITFPISVIESTAWNLGVIPTTATIIYTTDGSEPDYITQPLIPTTTIVEGNALPTFTLRLGPIADYQGDLLRYKILPEFYYDGTVVHRDFFPQKFLDMHTITGSKIIVSNTETINIQREEATNLCEVGPTGYRTLQRISLVNGDGFYVDGNGDLSADEWQYILKDVVIPDDPYVSGPIWIAKYTVDPATGKAVIDPADYNPTIAVIDLPYKEYLEALVTTEIVKVYDTVCEFITLTITLNAAISSTAPIVVTQSGVNRVLSKVTESQYTCLIYPNVDVTISSRTGFGVLSTTYTKSGGYATDSSIDFGLVVDLKIGTTIPLPGDVNSTDTFVVEKIDTGYFGSPIHFESGACQYTVGQPVGYYDGTLESPDIIAGPSDTLFTYEYVSDPRPLYDVEFTSSYSNGTFINLTPGTFITKDNGILFLTLYNDITTSTF